MSVHSFFNTWNMSQLYLIIRLQALIKDLNNYQRYQSCRISKLDKCCLYHTNTHTMYCIRSKERQCFLNISLKWGQIICWQYAWRNWNIPAIRLDVDLEPNARWEDAVIPLQDVLQVVASQCDVGRRLHCRRKIHMCQDCRYWGIQMRRITPPSRFLYKEEPSLTARSFTDSSQPSHWASCWGVWVSPLPLEGAAWKVFLNTSTLLWSMFLFPPSQGPLACQQKSADKKSISTDLWSCSFNWWDGLQIFFLPHNCLNVLPGSKSKMHTLHPSTPTSFIPMRQKAEKQKDR